MLLLMNFLSEEKTLMFLFCCVEKFKEDSPKRVVVCSVANRIIIFCLCLISSMINVIHFFVHILSGFCNVLCSRKVSNVYSKCAEFIIYFFFNIYIYIEKSDIFTTFLVA